MIYAEDMAITHWVLVCPTGYIVAIRVTVVQQNPLGSY